MKNGTRDDGTLRIAWFGGRGYRPWSRKVWKDQKGSHNHQQAVLQGMRSPTTTSTHSSSGTIRGRTRTSRVRFSSKEHVPTGGGGGR
jgi:hypothetical protein